MSLHVIGWIILLIPFLIFFGWIISETIKDYGLIKVLKSIGLALLTIAGVIIVTLWLHIGLTLIMFGDIAWLHL